MNRKLMVAAAGIATGLAGATLALGQGDYGRGMMGGYGSGYGWGLGAVGMLLWWVLIVLAIVLLARWIFGGTPRRDHREGSGRALKILRERYARSEIDKQEFEEKKRDLK